jgi:hypothetical protein
MLSRKPAAFIQVGCGLAAILLFLDMVALESDLRNGLVPVAAGLLALSTAGVIMFAGRENIGRPRRLARAAAVVAALGLTWIACFSTSLAVLSLIGSSLLDADTPSPRRARSSPACWSSAWCRCPSSRSASAWCATAPSRQPCGSCRGFWSQPCSVVAYSQPELRRDLNGGSSSGGSVCWRYWSPGSRFW